MRWWLTPVVVTSLQGISKAYGAGKDAAWLESRNSKGGIPAIFGANRASGVEVWCPRTEEMGTAILFRGKRQTCD